MGTAATKPRDAGHCRTMNDSFIRWDGSNTIAGERELQECSYVTPPVNLSRGCSRPIPAQSESALRA
jgi:hypothetical protein